MKSIESFNDLDDMTRTAVVDLLYRLGDDALVMGHRDSEWTGLAPILEEDIAFSSMAQDEIGHAHVYYQMLHELGEPDPDTIAFGRKPKEWKCAALVCVPNNRDWAFCIMRKFLFDSAELVRLAALTNNSLVPLAQLARKLKGEKNFHLMHDRLWVTRLGQAVKASQDRMQRALDQAYPLAMGLFESTGTDEVLAQKNICPREADLMKEWESAIIPVLTEAGLQIDANAQPVLGGRTGKHPEALGELLNSMQLVYNIDPSAKW